MKKADGATDPLCRASDDLGGARPKSEPIEGTRKTDNLAFLENLEDAMRRKTLDGRDKEGNTP